MKRLIRIAGILAITALLAGCDKCGDPVKFTLIDSLKSCSDSNPQG